MPRSERSARSLSGSDSELSDQDVDNILIDVSSDEESKDRSPNKSANYRKPRASKYLHLPPDFASQISKGPHSAEKRSTVAEIQSSE